MADSYGIDALDAEIRAHTRELKAALPGIVRKGGEVVEAEVRARAPRDSGELVSQLDTTELSRETFAAATVQIEDSGPGGVGRHAIFQEYGTSNMPANPFFRPGVEAVRERVETQVADDIAGVIGAK